MIGPDCGRACESGASLGPISEATAPRGSTWQMSRAFLTLSTHNPRYQSTEPLIPFNIQVLYLVSYGRLRDPLFRLGMPNASGWSPQFS